MDDAVAQNETRLERLGAISAELVPSALALESQCEEIRSMVAKNDLKDVAVELMPIGRAVGELRKLVKLIENPGEDHELLQQTDVAAAQKKLRHDLRTPINGIKGYGEMLLEDLEDLDGEVLRPRLSKLVEDSIALSERIYTIVDLGADEEALSESTPAQPVAQASPKPNIPEVAVAPRPAPEPGKILVVDDMAANRDILKQRLSREGHHVEVAYNGQDALKVLSRERFELVLLDVMMPGMDGYEVLARIKNDESLRDIPVIMVSALDELDSVIRCIELGAEDYLPKNFDPVLLRARVNASLEKKKWADREHNHIRRLAAAMKQVESGDLAVSLDETGDDVFADLYHGFNQMTQELRDEAEILRLAQDLSGDLSVEALVENFVRSTATLLDAEHGILFLYDKKTDELWSYYESGAGLREIRIDADSGLTGYVFKLGRSINIDNAAQHPSFEGIVHSIVGAEPKSVLAMPITTQAGETIGVVQVLNKRTGQLFTTKDETRLSAFCAQIAFTLYNAQLLEETVNIKNYNENILQSTSTSLITLDPKGVVVTANERAEKLFGDTVAPLIGKSAADLFGNDAKWVLDSVERALRLRRADRAVDVTLTLPDARSVSVNLTTVPLRDGSDSVIGSMISIEDVSNEHRMRATMTRYMSKEVVDRLLESGEKSLRGDWHKATVLFTDISDFTLLTEEMGAQDTVRMLNDYFEEMVDVLFEHRGVLDKYIGDALMAMFGVPMETSQDADNAVAAAIGMMEALRNLNRRRKIAEQAPIDMRIGINTGDLVAGNIGSQRRMEYTVVGECVNLASRLEEANKFYGTRILVGESTVKAMQKSVLMREIDIIRVPGREQPVALFEPLDYHTRDTMPNMDRILVPYQRGLDCYRQKEWDGAIKFFEEVLALEPYDRPSMIHVERAMEFKVNPPPEPWNMAYDLDVKHAK